MRTKSNIILITFAFVLSILVLTASLASLVFGKLIFVSAVLALLFSTGALIKTSRRRGLKEGRNPRRRFQGGKAVKSQLIAWILLIIGLFSLLSSVYFDSMMLAFVGLGLTFWGAIIFYISREPYVKSRLLDATTLPSLQSLNEMLGMSGFSSKGIYLPPKLLDDPETSEIYVDAKSGDEIPKLEAVQKDVGNHESSSSALIRPVGSKLMKTLEDELETSFLWMEMEDFRWKLPELLIENLEIAENVKVRNEGNSTIVEIEGSPYSELCDEVRKLEKVSTLMGCPLCSAIASALTRVTGKPVVIDKEDPDPEEDTMRTQFQILEEN